MTSEADMPLICTGEGSADAATDRPVRVDYGDGSDVIRMED
jgi:hypothetical protein